MFFQNCPKNSRSVPRTVPTISQTVPRTVPTINPNGAKKCANNQPNCANKVCQEVCQDCWHGTQKGVYLGAQTARQSIKITVITVIFITVLDWLIYFLEKKYICSLSCSHCICIPLPVLENPIVEIRCLGTSR